MLVVVYQSIADSDVSFLLWETVKSVRKSCHLWDELACSGIYVIKSGKNTGDIHLCNRSPFFDLNWSWEDVVDRIQAISVNHSKLNLILFVDIFEMLTVLFQEKSFGCCIIEWTTKECTFILISNRKNIHGQRTIFSSRARTRGNV